MRQHKLSSWQGISSHWVMSLDQSVWLTSHAFSYNVHTRTADLDTKAKILVLFRCAKEIWASVVNQWICSQCRMNLKKKIHPGRFDLKSIHSTSNNVMYTTVMHSSTFTLCVAARFLTVCLLCLTCLTKCQTLKVQIIWWKCYNQSQTYWDRQTHRERESFYTTRQVHLWKMITEERDVDSGLIFCNTRTVLQVCNFRVTLSTADKLQKNL